MLAKLISESERERDCFGQSGEASQMKIRFRPFAAMTWSAFDLTLLYPWSWLKFPLAPSVPRWLTAFWAAFFEDAPRTLSKKEICSRSHSLWTLKFACVRLTSTMKLRSPMCAACHCWPLYICPLPQHQRQIWWPWMRTLHSNINSLLILRVQKKDCEIFGSFCNQRNTRTKCDQENERWADSPALVLL